MAAPDISAEPQRVLVCQGRLCRRKGAPESRRQWIRDTRDMPVTILSTGCLRVCGMGPVAVVYPEGIWLQRMTPEHIREGVQLLQGREAPLSPRIVYRLPRAEEPEAPDGR